MDGSVSPADLRLRLEPVFSRHNVKRAVLFGSFAKGTASEKSDVDLLVDSGLRGLRFVSLCEDICRTLGRDVDLLDMTHIDKNSRIDREIASTGVVIHEE
ncbi:MAG: nucleotidyltransferase domain-containing protein [Oscillospiraceae bacterium]|nr:nucleotidyltransferase domain-containing protein [Oscillospiraceae bacterium]